MVQRVATTAEELRVGPEEAVPTEVFREQGVERDGGSLVEVQVERAETGAVEVGRVVREEPQEATRLRCSRRIGNY